MLADHFPPPGHLPLIYGDGLQCTRQFCHYFSVWWFHFFPSQLDLLLPVMLVLMSGDGEE